MKVDFSSLSENAKVWVYPSSRKFYATELPEVQAKLDDFCIQWKSDDPDFKVAVQLYYDRCIVLGVEDADAHLSVSDIDVSVQFILGLQETFEVTLLDRMNVCFKQGEYVQYKELSDFKKLLKDKAITAKTIVFDNLVSTKGDFDQHWEIPLEESWYNRFLK